jgi:hypothetical protein
MVRLPSTLELLVEAGESAAEQYELLRWVRCLSPWGLADRAGVLALLDEVARECAVAARSPEQLPTGGPTPPQIQVGRLREASYLDVTGCEQFDSWPGEWETVSRNVAEARAALGPTLGTDGPPSNPSLGPPVGQQPAAPPSPARQPATPAADTIVCRTCGRGVPASARYCGYCGIRVS